MWKLGWTRKCSPGLSWAGLESNAPLGSWLVKATFLLRYSLLWPWQSEELMIPVVGCDCCCLFAAQNVFLPLLLVTNRAPPPCPWWETSFLWSYLRCLLTEERNAEMNGERMRSKEMGEMMTSFVALKLGLQIPQLDEANLSTPFFSISSFHVGFVHQRQKMSWLIQFLSSFPAYLESLCLSFLIMIPCGLINYW